VKRQSNERANQDERSRLLTEVLGKLTRQERLICIWKRAGFSDHEIAKHHGLSATSVATVFSRAKDKLRKAMRAKQ
jgi:DNA-directed RNA polymerase specialized sigma24 family protein